VLPDSRLAGLRQSAGVHLALGVDRERCAPARIDYLNKPVKFEDLQAALERRVLCA
jgi:hypothetical protein